MVYVGIVFIMLNAVLEVFTSSQGLLHFKCYVDGSQSEVNNKINDDFVSADCSEKLYSV